MKDEALLKKLKLKPEQKVLVANAPEGYLEKFGEGVVTQPEEAERFDAIHLFAGSKAELEQHFPAVIKRLKHDGLLWIAYPKGTSKLKTDINRDKGWDIVDAAGYRGIALIAMDNTWSSLRFRLKELVNSQKG